MVDHSLSYCAKQLYLLITAHTTNDLLLVVFDSFTLTCSLFISLSQFNSISVLSLFSFSLARHCCQDYPCFSHLCPSLHSYLPFHFLHLPFLLSQFLYIFTSSLWFLFLCYFLYTAFLFIPSSRSDRGATGPGVARGSNM